MRRIVFAFALGCALSSCSHEMTPQEKKAADDKAIAEVEANQTPPPDTPVVQSIATEEVDRLGLIGGSCTFYGRDDAEQVKALIAPDAAYLKLDGEVERLAADKGSKPGPMDTRGHYDGKKRSLDVLIKPQGKSVVSDTLDYPAQLTMRDGVGRVQAMLEGSVRCGS